MTRRRCIRVSVSRPPWQTHLVVVVRPVILFDQAGDRRLGLRAGAGGGGRRQAAGGGAVGRWGGASEAGNDAPSCRIPASTRTFGVRGKGLVCLDVRDPPHTQRISRQVNVRAYLWQHLHAQGAGAAGEGLVFSPQQKRRRRLEWVGNEVDVPGYESAQWWLEHL